MTSPIILCATHKDGTRGFYTGRAGDLFVSANRSEAFVFYSLEYARSKATKMNAFAELHGWWFIVPAEGSDLAAA